jgi:hypothetical protein
MIGEKISPSHFGPEDCLTPLLTQRTRSWKLLGMSEAVAPSLRVLWKCCPSLRHGWRGSRSPYCSASSAAGWCARPGAAPDSQL